MARFYKVKPVVGRRRFRKNRLIGLLLVLLILVLGSGCQRRSLENSGMEEAENGRALPGQPGAGAIVDGIYRSSDGLFTVRADEEQWEPDEESGGPGLRYKEDGSVSITFSRTEGLGSEAVQNFSDGFVDSYLEGIRTLYPDARLEDSLFISGQLARLDISMTDESGQYPMYQILYLATDGKDGYLITAAMPEEQADSLKEKIYKIVESIRFRTDTTDDKAEPDKTDFE